MGDPNINVTILIFFGKFKELPGTTFLCFEFSTRVPKNGPKNGPKLKKRRQMTKTPFPLGQKLGKNSFSKKVDCQVRLKIDQNGKLVSLKKLCFLAFLTKIWDPENFTFASENGPKRPND